MSEDNKGAARRVFEAWESGELDSLDELIAADAVDHDPYNPNAADGLEGFKRTITMYREAFPDVRFDIEDQIAEGDKVVTRWTAHGTHQGQLMGFEPTGKESVLTGIGIDRFEGGKIVEVWGNWDTLAMMQNIGAIPETQAAQA